MGGGAFNWLKMPGIVRKSPNQAEIRLADLQKILSNRRKGDQPVGRAGVANRSLSLISGKNG
jgi:hypothetical protein